MPIQCIAIDAVDTVRTMERNVHDAEAVAQGCDLLGLFAEGSVHEWAGQDTPRVIRTLVRIMKQHPNHAEVLGKLCFLLKRSCYWRADESNECALPASMKNLQGFYEEGGLEAVVGIMEVHKDDAPLHLSTCTLIAVLLDSIQDIPQASLQSAVKAMIDCMNTHADDHNLLPTAINCLRKLLFVVKDGVAHDSSIKALLECLRRPSLQISDQGFNAHHAALAAVLVFFPNNSHVGDLEKRANAERLWKNGAFDLIISVIERELERGDAYFDQESGRTVTELALLSLALMYEHATQPHEEARITLIVRVTKMLCKHAHITNLAIVVMHRASFNDDKNREHIGKQGLRAVLDALVLHKPSSDQLEEYMACYGVLGQGNVAWLTEDSILGTFLGLMEDNLQCVLWQGNACTILNVLVREGDPQHIKALVEAGGVTLIVRAMSIHTKARKEWDVQKIGSTVLTCIARCFVHEPDMRARLVRQGAADAVIRAVLKSQSLDTEWTQGDYLTGLISLISAHPENMAAAGISSIPAFVRLIVSSDQAKMQLLACGTINEILHYAAPGSGDTYIECRNVLGECGGIAALKMCLQTSQRPEAFDQSEAAADPTTGRTPAHDILMYAFFALASACFEHKANQDLCASQKLVSTILQLMSRHQNQKDVLMAACFALQGIVTGHKENSAELLSHKGAKHIFRARSLARDCASACTGVLDSMLEGLAAADDESQVGVRALCLSTYLFNAS
jgi:hypothetical protein